MTILFAYDGSESADAAIAAAGQLFGDGDTTADVLTVWEPLTLAALRAARFGGSPPIPPDVADVDRRAEEQAKRLAEHGARLAREAGFDARPLLVAGTKRIPETIVESADELEVDLIVMGARGLTGIAAFLGSVSNHVLQHAHRPALIVPPPAPSMAGEAARPAVTTAWPRSSGRRAGIAAALSRPSKLPS